MEKKMEPASQELQTPQKPHSMLYDAWRRLKRNKAAMAGAFIVVLLIFLSIFADVLFNYNDVVIKVDIPNQLQPPSFQHPFGTDEQGRDILARVVHGARISLFIGVLSTVISAIIGSILGAAAGYFGRLTDTLISRFMDMLLAIPGTLLAIAIVAVLGSSMQNLIIALTVSSIPKFARYVRGSVLMVKDVEYVEAARAIGATDGSIILHHIMPNCMGVLFVQMTLNISFTILSIAGLSFLGLGIQAPTPEWGSMLSSARSYIRDYSYMTFFPGLAIMLSILAFNLLGDGLRDALDPRLK